MKKQKCKGEPCDRPSKKKNLKQEREKGITLIALVITIIVLLILAGVALKLVTGGDGILGKAEKAVNLTNEAMAKEKLELKMVEYMADKIENPGLSVNDYLQSIEGCTGVVEDEAEDNPGGYIVTIDGFGFRVSPKGEVLGRAEKLTSPQISITQSGSKVEVTMTQRGEEIVNLEILNSDGNVLTNIPKENMTLIEGKYVIEYTFADQGNYSIVVTTKNGEKYTKEIVIDLNPPVDPVITSNYGYPILTKTGIKLDGTTKIEYDTTSETENFYSLDGTNWQKYTGEFQATAGTVYAKSVKKSNGLESIISKEIGIPSDAVGPEAYDGNADTPANLENNEICKYYYMNIDPQMRGGRVYMKIKSVSASYVGLGFGFILSDGSDSVVVSLGYNTANGDFDIPGNATKLYIIKQCNVGIYEIAPGKTSAANVPQISWNVTKEFSMLTETGLKVGRNDATITYDERCVKKLYSLDGTNWQDYLNEVIKVEYGKTIYAKGIDKFDLETMSSSSSVGPTDTVDNKACDGNEETATDSGDTSQVYIEVDSGMWGKNVFLNVKSPIWAYSWGYAQFILSDGSVQDIFSNRDLSNTPFLGVVAVPENTIKICINRQSSVGIYEIRPVNE